MADTGPPEGRTRSPVLTVLMVILGVILLLPGVCVVITALVTVPTLLKSMVTYPPSDPYFWQIIALWAVFWLICLLISYSGIRLIQRAWS
jgi:hypothetical protein